MVHVFQPREMSGQSRMSHIGDEPQRKITNLTDADGARTTTTASKRTKETPDV